MTVHYRALAVVATAVFLTAAGCDKSSPGTPAAPSPSVAPTPVVTVELRIEGPGSLAPGEVAQFKAIALQSDRSTRDVTSEAAWRSSSEAALQVTAAGMATGIASGGAHVIASVGGRSRSQEVLVLPRGTYRLAGQVLESDLPIAGAAVNVIAGPAAGLGATADPYGRYALYGVVDDVQVRASKDGYEHRVQRVSVTGNQSLDFDLAPLRREDVSGRYLLSITAGECTADASSTILPAEARVRTYQASVTQDGPHLGVTLNGADFIAEAKFGGRVAPDAVSFTLSGELGDYYYDRRVLPDLVERLAGQRFLIISGEVSARIIPAGLSGMLRGLFRVGEGPNPPRGTRIADCRSNEHQFVMSR